ncbi:ArsR/SmtB family transcription factor [Desulfurobacterium sp.]
MKITEQDIKNLSLLFKALSHKDRVKILLFLTVNQEKNNLRELSRKIKIKPAMLSNHLKELVIAGLVSRERERNSVLYYMDEIQKEWAESILLPAVEFTKQ